VCRWCGTFVFHRTNTFKNPCVLTSRFWYHSPKNNIAHKIDQSITTYETTTVFSVPTNWRSCSFSFSWMSRYVSEPVSTSDQHNARGVNRKEIQVIPNPPQASLGANKHVCVIRTYG